MQYVEKTKGTPYRIDNHQVPNEFEWLPNGDLKVIEIIKRDVYFKKEEAIKAKIQIENKIKFHKHEISDEYKQRVKKDIDILQIVSDEWNEAIKKQENPVGEQK